MSNVTLTCDESTRNFLLTPQAIRQRAALLASFAEKGQTHFRVHRDQLEKTTDFVLKVTKENYPDLKVPIHSRYRHFQAGGFNRTESLIKKLSHLSAVERAKSLVDLVVVSVLLDAGAGGEWKYHDAATGTHYSRSEGLGVASFNMFEAGLFSSDKAHPLRVDAEGLAQLSVEKLKTAFQVGPQNPFVGSEGRCELLKKLASALTAQKTYFSGSILRPGNLVDYFLTCSEGKNLSALKILNAVLLGFSSIWPPRINLSGINVGDIWHHPLLGTVGTTESLVPFHKLSQWLTYSLFEPLQESGLQITDAEKLTGLAEYRNGGLILDSGLIELRDASMLSKLHSQESPLVVEWRALTVTLLDEIWQMSLQKLGFAAEQFPLARILEGGTWAAGRVIAKQKRPDGGPPLQLKTDGTLF